MKQRQFDILQKILQNRGASLEELMGCFEVSKRTIYYDINEINYEIRDFGRIENINKSFVYLGQDTIYQKYNLNIDYTYNIEDRQRYILEKIFVDEFTTIEEMSESLMVSKSTIVNDIKVIKNNLSKEGIDLIFDKKYKLIADESKIRDVYINYMYSDQNLIEYFDERIEKINIETNLHLTDYSISLLSKFIKFTDKRRKSKNFLKESSLYDDVKNSDCYNKVKSIVNYDNEHEVKLLVAFIASMTNLNNDNILENIESFVENLIMNFEKFSATDITNKEEFKKEISRHLQSSYYRLKFKFPIYNGSLEDIKTNYPHLYSLVENSVKSTNAEVFRDMRESEIGFLVMYFGARIEGISKSRNKVVIVCPNGKVVSRMLQTQLYNYLPTIDIVGVISIFELDNARYQYDYIISTVPIENHNNVILVKPILTTHNISELYQKLLNINSLIDESSIDKIINVISKNAVIKDKEKLKLDLLDFITEKNKDIKQYHCYTNLSEILTKEKILKLKEVENWEEAIKKASQILIDNRSINKQYVEDMIYNINKIGSYVVLVDGVAMPHAQNHNLVYKVDASLMLVEQPVEMKGKKVDIFIVISVLDNISHLKMLATISDILDNKNNIEILRRGDYREIRKLILKYEEEVVI